MRGKNAKLVTIHFRAAGVKGGYGISHFQAFVDAPVKRLDPGIGGPVEIRFAPLRIPIPHQACQCQSTQQTKHQYQKHGQPAVEGRWCAAGIGVCGNLISDHIHVFLLALLLYRSCGEMASLFLCSRKAWNLDLPDRLIRVTLIFEIHAVL
jgi:hypothetical protein